MKHLIIICTFFSIVLGNVLAETPTDFIKRWGQDFNKNDPKIISKFYEQSEDLDMLVSVGLWHKGFDEMFAAYKGDSEQIEYYDSTLKDLKVRTFDNTALVSFKHLFKFKVLATGERVQVHIRTTSTLRKIDGKWLIVLEHSSPIKDQPRVVRIK